MNIHLIKMKYHFLPFCNIMVINPYCNIIQLNIAMNPPPPKKKEKGDNLCIGDNLHR